MIWGAKSLVQVARPRRERRQSSSYISGSWRLLTRRPNMSEIASKMPRVLRAISDLVFHGDAAGRPSVYLEG
jgi:hypothetical protein